MREYVRSKIANTLIEVPSQYLDCVDKAGAIKKEIIHFIRDVAESHNIMTSEVVDILRAILADRNARQQLKYEAGRTAEYSN